MIFNILAVDEVWVALRLSSLIWCFCKNNRQCLPKTYLNIYQLVEPLTFMFVLLFSFGSFIHLFVFDSFFLLYHFFPSRVLSCLPLFYLVQIFAPGFCFQCVFVVFFSLIFISFFPCFSWNVFLCQALLFSFPILLELYFRNNLNVCISSVCVILMKNSLIYHPLKTQMQ